MTGFLLGLLNPPVLIFWLLIYGVINTKITVLSIDSELNILILFFVGVYLGKVFTLFLYSKFSIAIKHKFQNINLVINKITGVLLFVIGIVQFGKFFYAF